MDKVTLGAEVHTQTTFMVSFIEGDYVAMTFSTIKGISILFTLEKANVF